ncbi:FAD-dependent oxidoreductase [Maribellus comscasis]|uniref:FAD-dependent oxidoreductase n=1 Tax=Maribellus comscasis TaxID=2681766 RepID=A0A6I6K1D8_9BACT|nr:FAD-dependent oxidoreductase [Maribellus comscasis]QGY46232.1 FAD-dependent oxidoreductase [Maribellus comscasis]
MKKVEFLVVGQGLAGTMLAFEMLKKSLSFHIVSSPEKRKASLVAAGMVNPLVFKRLTKSWLADKLVPVMKERYQNLENVLGERLFFEKDILKPLSAQEKQLWQERKFLPEFSSFIREITNEAPVENISDAAGFGIVTHSGYLNLVKFLKLSEDYFRSESLLTEIDFLFQKFEPQCSNFEVGGIVAEKIVFCEGAHLRQNPFFDFVKLKPVKGEVLQIFAPELSEKYILNKGVFVLPVGHHRFKVGSTYEWQDLTEKPTKEGKKSIAERLDNLVSVNYSIENHWAGIRPAIADRRPVLGEHPNYSKLFIFNGLGTKGVMLAPFFAKEMVRYLCSENYQLSEEVQVTRFV